MKENLVLDRVKAGKCPISNRLIEKDYKLVQYKDQWVRVSRKYPSPASITKYPQETK